MNAQRNDCDRQRIDAFLDSNHVALEDPQLIEHLDSCPSCREYIESRAAEAQSWAQATDLLKPSEYDNAGSIACSAATIGHQSNEQPLAVRNVLASLAPTDDPNRLGRLGSYEVSGVVGVGGMGIVLKAVDPALDRVVAIKVMAPHLANTETARTRFAREAKAAAAVLHPNVIPIHSVSSESTIPFLVMSYIRGGSLQKRLQREGPLATVEILRIGAQVAAGLAAAHEQGLVHRDIKPENILLEDSVERVTLTDFGLARAVDDASVTREGTIAGTPQYMSPEQARGESVDQKSDLFSLGSVLYALCTGRPPFRADTSYGVMRRIIDEQATPIREINPDIPEWLVKIVDTLMAKESNARYGSAHELQTLLESCLGHVQRPAHTQLPVELLQSDVDLKTQATKNYISFKTVTLSILAVLAAVVLFAILPMLSNGSSADAEKAYAMAQAQLHPRKSTGDPTNAVGALLTHEDGRKYLQKLSREFHSFTYDDRLSLDGESAGAVFIWNRKDSHPNPQMLIRSFSANGATKGLTAGLPTQVHVNELRIEKNQLLIAYTASDREADRAAVERIFKLSPGKSYETAIEVTSLIDGDTDWIEPFKHGTLLERGIFRNEPTPKLISRIREVGIGRRLAMDELIRREEVGRLNANESDELVDIVLEHQADRTRAWDPAMGDLIEKRWKAGVLKREFWERYTSDFLDDIYDIKVRSRIVIGSPAGLLVRLLIQDLRCGSGEHIKYLLCERDRVTRVGTTLVGRVNGRGVRQVGHNNHGEYTSNKCNMDALWEEIQPGKQIVSYQVELAILEAGGDEPIADRDVFASRSVTHETETTFLPRGQTTVTVNVDPTMKDEVDSAFKLTHLKVEPMSAPYTDKKYHASVMLDIGKRPIDTAFDIVLKDGEKEYKVGSVETKADSETHFSSGADCLVDLSGKEVDLILRPSPQAAEDSIDLFEIWGEEIVFKDVLVK